MANEFRHGMAVLAEPGRDRGRVPVPRRRRPRRRPRLTPGRSAPPAGPVNVPDGLLLGLSQIPRPHLPTRKICVERSESTQHAVTEMIFKALPQRPITGPTVLLPGRQRLAPT